MWRAGGKFPKIYENVTLCKKPLAGLSIRHHAM
jgi:hypothetical protein